VILKFNGYLKLCLCVSCRFLTNVPNNGLMLGSTFKQLCNLTSTPLLVGCTVLNLYESTCVHKRNIDLDLAVLRIHTINTFRTQKYLRILTLNIYLKRNTYVYKGI
jgi:hypothetical protein